MLGVWEFFLPLLQICFSDMRRVELVETVSDRLHLKENGARKSADGGHLPFCIEDRQMNSCRILIGQQHSQIREISVFILQAVDPPEFLAERNAMRGEQRLGLAEGQILPGTDARFPSNGIVFLNH